VRALLLALVCAGCFPHQPPIETVLLGDPVSADLKTCREIARQSYYEAHKSKAAALEDYEACKARAGLK
jgi:hypothetical protein